MVYVIIAGTISDNVRWAEISWKRFWLSIEGAMADRIVLLGLVVGVTVHMACT
jgi:hypothetical protein